MADVGPDTRVDARKSAKSWPLSPRVLLRLAGQTVWASLADRIALAAAGCAFWAMMALFPAISTLISAIGLILDPEAIETQMHLLNDLLPQTAYMLIQNRVHELLSHPRDSLSTSLIVSSVLTFLSSATGSKAMISAVSVAYDAEDARGFLHFQLAGLLMTTAAVLGGVTTLMVLLALPPALELFGLPLDTAQLVHIASLALLVLAFATTIALLYRFGPVRGPIPDRKVMPGTILATVLWLMASEGLSLYIDHMTSFGATYGSLGAVAGIMLWLYATIYAVLLGAELNRRIEVFRHGN